VSRVFLVAVVLAALGGASALAGAPPAFAATNLLPERGPAASWRVGESSVAVLFGVGWFDNDAFNEDLVANDIEPIENGFEYGLQYRRRVSRWISIGAELARIDGRTNTTDGSNSEFGIAATPLLVDLFVHPVQMNGTSLTFFGGVGPLIATRLSQTFANGAVLAGSKTGFIVQAGAEGELRFGPNFGFFLRGLMRKAETDQVTVDDGTGLEPVRYDINFNGPGVTFGPRWYFGGAERQPTAPPPSTPAAPDPVIPTTPAPTDSTGN
jgi:hypothetical protein